MKIQIDTTRIINSNLSAEEFIFLYLIYLKELKEAQMYLNRIHSLKNLEQHGYIKIMSDEELQPLEDIELRQAAIELFKDSENKSEEILSYLAHKLNTKEQYVRRFVKSVSNKRFVSARLNEGYTTDDCKAVIDVMISKWGNSKMKDYLRPETLFNATKFQSYILEVSKDEETFDNNTLV